MIPTRGYRYELKATELYAFTWFLVLTKIWVYKPNSTLFGPHLQFVDMGTIYKALQDKNLSTHVLEKESINFDTINRLVVNYGFPIQASQYHLARINDEYQELTK